jgi:GntR family transcriptional regulator
LSTDSDWDPALPIYLQLRQRVIALILDGTIKEGEPLASVRVVAAEYRLNPLTALKAYQRLADEGLLESRRGRGMFVSAGARARLLTEERKRFLAEEWPRVMANMIRLGFDPEELLTQARHAPIRRRK